MEEGEDCSTTNTTNGKHGNGDKRKMRISVTRRKGRRAMETMMW